MNKWRYALFSLMLTGFLWGASACSEGEPVETTAVTSPVPTAAATPAALPTAVRPLQTGEIRVWTSWDMDKLSVLSEYMDAFGQQYPGIQIFLTYYPEEELLSAFEKAYAEGSPPTILIGPSAYGPELKRGDLVLDLTSRLSETYQQDVYPYLWSQVKYDDMVVGLPLEQRGYVLIRNRQLVPDRAATVEELAAASSDAANGLIVGATLDLGFPFSSSMLPVCDAILTDAYFQPAFNTDQGECWMELIARLNRIGRSSFNDDEDREFFLQDRSAWIIDGTWTIEETVQEIGENWITVDFWPIYELTEQRLAGYVWTENAYLVSGNNMENTEISWSFLSYLGSAEVQAEIATRLGTRQIPVLQSVPLDDLLLRQTVFVLERGVPLPVLVDLDAYARGLEPEMLDVMRGGDPGLALQRAETTMDKLLNIP